MNRPIRKKLNFSLLFFGLLFGTTIFANNTEPIMVLKVEGEEKKMAYMYQTVDGPIQLFFEIDEVVEYQRDGINGFFAVGTRKVNYLYIGTGTGNEVERISPGNFRRLVRKYLPDATDLHKRIGKRGFRFENLPSMILYYNKHISENPTPLTKQEVAKLIPM